MLLNMLKKGGMEMKSSNIISTGKIGVLQGITQKGFECSFHWKVDLTHIKLNSGCRLAGR